MAQQIEKENNQMLNELFEAIDLIAQTKVEHLGFDKTLTCQIINIDKRDKGEYIVTDGSADFPAYSENTSYGLNSWVYVTVPNGDFNNRKIIVGKYITDNTEYSSYRNPLDSYLDITGNLIGLSNEDETDPNEEIKLIANGHLIDNTFPKEKVIWRTGKIATPSIYENTALITWSDEDIENTKQFSQYNRLGIRAEFKTLLGKYNLVKGNFGLRLDIVSMQPGTTFEENSYKYYSYTLDIDDMFGNPYNFVVWTQQQQVFDISDLNNIIGIQLVLFEDDNFTDEYQVKIPGTNEDAQAAYLQMYNILAKNIYISLGYDLNEFTDDELFIYTFDPMTYVAYVSDDHRGNISTESMLNNVNKKDIYLRWVHIGEDGRPHAIDNINDVEKWENNAAHRNDPLGIVHWYRWELTEDLIDPFAGAFWREVDSQKNHFIWNDFIPNPKVANEKIKVIIEYPCAEKIQQDYEDTIDDYLASVELDPENPNAEEEERQIYAAQLYSQITLYESDILEFINEHEVPDQTTINLIRGLQVVCDVDNLNGIYRIYNSDGNIMNKGEATKRRILTAQFDVLVTGDKRLDSAEVIKWYIPKTNTMIEPPVVDCEYAAGELDSTSDTDFYIITRTNVNIPEGEALAHAAGDIVPTALEQIFRIKEYYNERYINNTIKCVIYKNNSTYSIDYTMYFGTSGTNGTEYTLTVTYEKYENNKWIPMVTPVFTAGSNEQIRLVPHIFDYENKEITDSYNNNAFTYSFYASSNPNGLTLTKSGRNCKIAKNTELNNLAFSCYYHNIIKVIVTKAVNIPSTNENGNNGLTVNLTTYCPIAIRSSDEYTNMDGDSRVTYGPSGTNPTYYKGEYAIYTSSTSLNKVPGVKWSMDLGGDTATQYYPRIDENNGTLVVPSMFISNNRPTVSIIAKLNNNPIWCQPLYISQETYASAMLNSWDGSLTIDEANGTIMSTMMGAGYKDNENAFNGVLMGNVQKGAGIGSSNADTGLFGYNAGAQSFGFRINGTAFLGKSGRGQILFNGNKGTIQSANYGVNNAAQMQIDVDDGIIDIKGIADENNKRASVYLSIDGSSSSKPYFQIKDEIDKSLIHISKNNYYLQSSDFNSSNRTGVRFDLKNGKLEGYNFTLKALSPLQNDNSKLTGLTIDSSGNPYIKITAAATYAGASINHDVIDVFNISQNGLNFDISDGNTNDAQGVPNTRQITSKFFLKSTDYKVNESGTLIDVENGKITSYNFGIVAKYNGSDTTLQKKYIRINSAATNYPLIIGTGSGTTAASGDFAVRWDGYFKATQGLIGGWALTNLGLFSDGAPSTGGGTITGIALYSSNHDAQGETDPLRITVGSATITAHYYYLSNGTYVEDTTSGHTHYNEASDNNRYISYDSSTNSGTSFSVTKGGQITANKGIIAEANITGGSINRAKISSGSINNARINNATINSGTITSADISSGTITSATISSATITNCSVTGSLTVNGKVFTNHENTFSHITSITLTDVKTIVPKTNVTVSGNVQLSIDASKIAEKLSVSGSALTGFSVSGSGSINTNTKNHSFTGTLETEEKETGKNIRVSYLNKTFAYLGTTVTESSQSACFVKGTQILMANLQYKSIEHINLNDMVMSWNHITKQYEPQQVIKKWIRPIQKISMMKIYFEDNSILECAASHPILNSKKQWVTKNIIRALKDHHILTKQISTTSQIYGFNHLTKKIKTIKYYTLYNDTLYDFTVAKNHTYIANNCVVHNPIQKAE